MPGLVTADLHLNDVPRDAYRFGTFERLPDLARKHRADAVIINGDLTEEKDRHAAPLVNRIVRGIAAIAKVCPVYVNRGNHDYRDVQSPFYGFLAELPGVRWINEPKAMRLEGVGRCLFLPYTLDHVQDWDLFDFRKYDWVFAHNTFAGAVSDNGGMKLDGIPTSYMRGARVISGDIHRPQRVDCVTYVGAPYTVDFGDDYEPRMLLVSGQSSKSLPMSGPRKLLLEIDAKAKDIELDAEPGDIVKIRVLISRQDMGGFQELRRAVRAQGEANGVVVYSVEPALVDKPKLGSVKRASFSRRSDAELLAAFGTASNVDDRLMKLGRRIIEEA